MKYSMPNQCLSQDLETECPKLAIVTFLGGQIFKGGPQYTQISTINMYKFIKIRQDILLQCHGNHMEMKRFNYMLEIDILRNCSQKDLGVLGSAFYGSGCPKRHPDDLLAKTMRPKIFYKILPILGVRRVVGWLKCFIKMALVRKKGHFMALQA